MAIYCSESPCAICGKPVGDRESGIFGFTYIDSKHPLIQQVDDAVVHYHCLNTWVHRDEFIAAWNEEVKRFQLVRPLTLSKTGEVEYAKDPLWERIVSLMLWPVFWIGSLIYEGVWRLICFFGNLNHTSGKKRGPKCRFCGTRLFTPRTKQCLNCGIDWHDPENIKCLKKN